jgi:hypothetical protein
MVGKFTIGGVCAVAAAFTLAGCGSTDSAQDATFEEPAKQWTVDTSGWWVPDDPTGCLNETVTCPMSAWPYREYGPDIAVNVFRHGETINLHCKAPTPDAIRNPLKFESVHWFYADYNGTFYWVPDIYVTKDDVEGIADGVPDCPSNTPGINGKPSGSAEPASTAEPTS